MSMERTTSQMDDERTNYEQPEEGADEFQELAPERDMYDELLDDPDIRVGAKEEIKRRLLSQTNQERPSSPAQQVGTRIGEIERWQEEFWRQDEGERDFGEWERRKAELERLRRQETLLLQESQHIQRQAGRAREVTENFIKAMAQRERRQFGDAEVTKYANRIRSQVDMLDDTVKADEMRLRQVLEHMIVPKAYRDWSVSQRSKGVRDDSAGRGSYDDDESEGEQRQRDPFEEKFPGADAEERRFLEGIGAVKRKGQEREDGLIPHKNGFIIPVGPGKRNQKGGE